MVSILCNMIWKYFIHNIHQPKKNIYVFKLRKGMNELCRDEIKKNFLLAALFKWFRKTSAKIFALTYLVQFRYSLLLFNKFLESVSFVHYSVVVELLIGLFCVSKIGSTLKKLSLRLWRGGWIWNIFIDRQRHKRWTREPSRIL